LRGEPPRFDWYQWEAPRCPSRTGWPRRAPREAPLRPCRESACRAPGSKEERKELVLFRKTLQNDAPPLMVNGEKAADGPACVRRVCYGVVSLALDVTQDHQHRVEPHAHVRAGESPFYFVTRVLPPLELRKIAAELILHLVPRLGSCHALHSPFPRLKPPFWTIRSSVVGQRRERTPLCCLERRHAHAARPTHSPGSNANCLPAGVVPNAQPASPRNRKYNSFGRGVVNTLD